MVNPLSSGLVAVVFVIFSFVVGLVTAQLTGHGNVTYYPYSHLEPRKRAAKKTFCGLTYDHFNLTSITAVQGLKTDDCFTWITVASAMDPNKYTNVLAVDRGNKILDLSVEAFNAIFRFSKRGQVKWKPVEARYCNHIWVKAKPKGN